MAETGDLTSEQVESVPLTRGKEIRKLADGDGLSLRIDARYKAWHFRYKRAGKDALMSFGVYPEVSLEAARLQRKAAWELLAAGKDPQAARQKERDQNWLEAAKTFGVVGLEYNGTQTHRSQKTQERCQRMLRHSAKLHGHTFPEIDRPAMLQCCRVLESAEKFESAHRLGIYFSQVFRYARDEGYFKGEDPTIGGFGKSLKPTNEQHRPGLTDLREVGSLMSIVDGWEWLDTSRGTGATVGRALQILARTVPRPGKELAAAEWSEFDLGGTDPRHDGQPTWVVPLRRMKRVKDGNLCDHVVPLSRQVVVILRAQYELTGHGKYVFPHARTDTRPMTDAALSAALLTLGYRDQHVPHGFRTTFKTLSQDMLKFSEEIVERQLAHKWGTPVRQAYDRILRLDERRVLMQQYSDLLDKLRDAN